MIQTTTFFIKFPMQIGGHVSLPNICKFLKMFFVELFLKTFLVYIYCFSLKHYRSNEYIFVEKVGSTWLSYIVFVSLLDETKVTLGNLQKINCLFASEIKWSMLKENLLPFYINNVRYLGI